jgi:hypothetical protein
MKKRFWVYLLLIACGLFGFARWRAPAAADAQKTVSLPGRMASDRTAATDSRPPLSPLPAELVRSALEPALRDPFAGVQPAVVPAAPTPPRMVVTPPPAAPPLDLVFAGRMTSPDGQETVFARQGTQIVHLVTGQALSNGYRVRAITDEAVELEYPALNMTARLELPSVPKQEIR